MCFNCMNKEIFPVLVATFYLLVYTILAVLNIQIPLVFIMFSLSPIVVIWMVYRVLTADVGPIRELEENEHWGYQDQIKE
jgi:membrane protein implicated in regulation of membrane protease activity